MVSGLHNHLFLTNHSHLDRIEAGVSQDVNRHSPGSKFFSQFSRDVRRGYIDGLTGLYRIEAFEKVVERFKKRSGQKDFSGYVVYFDADDLKLLNDTFGHSYGDAYLEGIGQLLQRVDGVSFRVGGDEFVTYVPVQRQRPSGRNHRGFVPVIKEAVLPFLERNKRTQNETDIEGFRNRLERDLNHLFDHFISYCDKDGNSISEIRVKMSFAIAPVKGDSILDVIEAKNFADRQMQQNKDAKKLEKHEAKKQEVLDESSGKTAFMKLLKENSPLGNEVANLAASIGIEIKNGELQTPSSIASMDPKVAKLQELLSDSKSADASRFLLGIVAGSPIYRQKDMVVRGTEPLGRGR